MPTLPLRPDDPRKVGKYPVRARLGAGSFGTVYLGQTPGRRLVAIKCFHAELADNPRFRRQFAAEVAAAQRVGAFHAAKVIDADPAGEPPYIVTAYIAGRTLAQVIDEEGALPETPLYLLGAGLAEALEAIHAVGLIHRDLKPANVIMADDGPRVIDFGIARDMSHTRRTDSRGIVGTPAFMAPEQAQGQPLTPACDVFSLGLVLAHASGCMPFGGGSADALIYRLVHEEPDSAGLPPRIRSLVAQCLTKEPKRRPTPAYLIEEFNRLLREDGHSSTLYDAFPSAARIGPATRITWQPSDRPVGTRSRRTALMVAFVALATVAIIAAQNSDRDNPDGFGETPALPTVTVGPTSGPASPPGLRTGPDPASATIPPLATPPTTANRVVPTTANRVVLAQLAPPDFDGYCLARGQAEAALTESDAYGWRCAGGAGGLDTRAVCQWTNHTDQVVDRMASFGDPHSWQCWSTNGELGPIDWDAYCRHLGFSGSRDKGLNNGSTWACEGSSDPLNARDACRAQFHTDFVIDRDAQFYATNGWQCWG